VAGEEPDGRGLPSTERTERRPPAFAIIVRKEIQPTGDGQKTRAGPLVDYAPAAKQSGASVQPGDDVLLILSAGSSGKHRGEHNNGDQDDEGDGEAVARHVLGVVDGTKTGNVIALR